MRTTRTETADPALKEINKQDIRLLRRWHGNIGPKRHKLGHSKVTTGHFQPQLQLWSR